MLYLSSLYSASYILASQNIISTTIRERLAEWFPLDSLPVVSQPEKRGKYAPLSVRRVKNTVKILTASEAVEPGQPLIALRGKIITKAEFHETIDPETLIRKPCPFVWSSSQYDLCVDSRDIGTDARFIRRCCTPNAEVKPCAIRHALGFCIFSKKPISKGTEITIPFDFPYAKREFTVECPCDRKDCPVRTSVTAAKARRSKTGGRGGTAESSGTSTPKRRTSTAVQSKSSPAAQSASRTFSFPPDVSKVSLESRPT